MKLTSGNVIQCMQHCITSEEDPNGVKYPMIAHSWILSSVEVAKAKNDIIEMLNGLPKEFNESTGGGWSFLMACNDRENNQWTGMHMVMEQLFCLGVAIKRVKFLLPRKMWQVLPGAVPYLMILNEDMSDEDMAKMMEDNKLIEDEENKEEEESSMSYTEGDEVRYNATGEFGIIKSVDEENELYTIEIDGVEYTATESDLS